MKNISNVENFMLIVETQYPNIKKFISNKSNDKIELELPCELGDTWSESSSVVEPIFKNPSVFEIKNSSVSFNEKHSYFKVLLELN